MNLWEKIAYEYSKGNSAIRQIIIINLAAFIFTILVGFIARLSGFSAGSLLDYFYIPSNLGVLLIRPWTLVTNVFFHAGFWHVVGNMILLYFIGRILEDFMSPQRIWTIFIAGGIVGALFFVIAFNVFPEFHEVAKTKKLLGASGGVTAILVATGMFLPRYVVRPFGLFNVEMRWVALFFVFRDLYMFPVSENTGGLFAHIGGAVFGVLFILYIQGKLGFTLPDIEIPKYHRMKVSKPDETQILKNRTSQRSRPNQEQIDAILDKISQSGYDSLTKSEKDILFKASE
jgi:membrane associated rhomboid family serine protease